MRKVSLTLVLLCLTTVPALAQDNAPRRTPFTPLDLVSLNRLSDPQVSADGLQVAYVVRRTDLAANRGRSDIFLIDLAHPEAAPRQLTTDAANDSSPRWSPDGRSLYFLSTRSGSSQVWRLPLLGGEPQQVTHYPLDVNALRVSPDGSRLALSLDS